MNRTPRPAACQSPPAAPECVADPLAAHQALDLLDRAILLLDDHGFDIAAAKAEEASAALRLRITMH